VVLYCRSGRRSSAAQEVLEDLGYSQVINAGGYDQLAALLQRN
jgi:phage shock protein E